MRRHASLQWQRSLRAGDGKPCGSNLPNRQAWNAGLQRDQAARSAQHTASDSNQRHVEMASM
jgi:hypothetical protein